MSRGESEMRKIGKFEAGRVAYRLKKSKIE